MSRYAFILGHSPLLSLAELTRMLDRLPTWKPLRFGGSVFIVELDTPIAQPQEWLNSLGGTIKVVALTSENFASLPAARKILRQELTVDTLLGSYFNQTGQKINFGFSITALDNRLSPKDFQIFLRTYGIDLKRALKERGLTSRLVVGNEAALSSVIVAKNKLLSSGAEIVVLFDTHYLALGKTVAVQDFEDYNLRDYGRPKADPKSGMVPPKLAQMLVNLAACPAGATILDPFCGMGTVLQEALLRGFQVIGRDRDDTAVAAARQNLAWLLKTYRLPAGRLRSIEPLDVRSLGRHFRAGSVDAIVTEGALGPPLRQIASENLKRRYIGKLSHLYLAAFEQYRRVLCPQGTVVTTFPYYRGPGPKRDFLPVLDRIKQLGYNLVDLFSPAVVEVCHCQATERGTLLYERSGQFVGREVAVFKK